MCGVYFNELSANGNIQANDVAEVFKTLIQCINWLKNRNVDFIKTDGNYGTYKITAQKTFYQLLNDKSIFNDDQKAFLLGSLSVDECLKDIIEDNLITESKCNGKDSIGLTVASDAVNNGLALSLSKNNWDNARYTLNLKSLDSEGNEVVSLAYANNASSTNGLTTYGFLFPVPAPYVPTSGKILVKNLASLFPNLVFSDDALKFIRITNSAEIIAQIYAKLCDLNKVAEALNNMPFTDQMFASKASPESDKRDKLPQLDVFFGDGRIRHCSWHLRYTPGAGRIHFSSEHGNGNTIFIGYIGQKIES